MKTIITLGFLLTTTLFISAKNVPLDNDPALIFNGKMLHTGDAVLKEDLYKLFSAHLETTSTVCVKSGIKPPFRCVVSLMDSWGTLKCNLMLPNTDKEKFNAALAKMTTGDKVYLNEISYCRNGLHMPARFVFTLQ